MITLTITRHIQYSAKNGKRGESSLVLKQTLFNSNGKKGTTAHLKLYIRRKLKPRLFQDITDKIANQDVEMVEEVVNRKKRNILLTLTQEIVLFCAQECQSLILKDQEQNQTYQKN